MISRVVARVLPSFSGLPSLAPSFQPILRIRTVGAEPTSFSLALFIFVEPAKVSTSGGYGVIEMAELGATAALIFCFKADNLEAIGRRDSATRAFSSGAR